MATISNTPRPGYVWDSTDNVWYPIGTGPHSHADYITSGSAINPNIVDAKGDIIAATAADTVARLAVGSNNQVLTADSSTATGLKWATPSGGGKVLQVVNATVSTAQTITSTSNTDVTNLAATITPSSSSSKILILVTSTVNYYRNGGDYYQGFSIKVKRNGTVVIANNDFSRSGAGNTSGGTVERSFDVLTCASYMDSPASTSALTYQIVSSVYNTANSGSITWQIDGTLGSITLMEIGA